MCNFTPHRFTNWYVPPNLIRAIQINTTNPSLTPQQQMSSPRHRRPPTMHYRDSHRTSMPAIGARNGT
ncbi:hypothetical protein Q7P36_004754 [Cladosporium allicinum]